MIRVAIDAMGGDLGPRIAFQAVESILQQHDSVLLHIYARPELTLPPQLATHSRVVFIPCSDVVAQNEAVDRRLFSRRDASLYRALDDLAQSKNDVVVTLGNTAVMVALARHLLGLLRPKLYPALIRELQTSPLRCLVDLGANVHCPPSMLQGFAQLGAAYLEVHPGEKARVGLLNVGVESSKGSHVIREANSLLARECWPSYAGFAEGFELFQGEKNVIVCDGIVGNAVLKAAEGLLAYIGAQVGPGHEINQLFAKQHRHGACLVGVRGNLVKGHGRSDVNAMVGALEYAIEVAQFNLAVEIEKKLHTQGIV
ncbi:fatty acid synthesis protein [Maribrevibacterium harenarium]|uniref:Phosphate acyltransferase n=1 Tax=Maribrevibacterium harenarium TaxID=2589817 RepID=A0A501X524_9GAMM|nr:fatty acid synthesis protein [Maribrevibacterium harenarium]TPE55507.1 fatty acid synthesis protein [Maribrevibacterium harenarium]